MLINDDIKFVIIGMISFAIVAIIGYITPTTIMGILFFALLIVVCWNLGIIVQDITNQWKRTKQK